MIEMIVTTTDLKCDYEVIGPVYYQVSNKGIFSSALSIAKKKYAEEIAALRAQGQMNEFKADWGFLYGEWSVGHNDFDAAFFISVQELKARAKRIGADAIVGMRQDIDMDTNGFAFFYLQMYGTAVKFKNPEDKDKHIVSDTHTNKNTATHSPLIATTEMGSKDKPQSESDTIELLLRYKQMLDNGEMTEEEFQRIKKTIL